MSTTNSSKDCIYKSQGHKLHLTTLTRFCLRGSVGWYGCAILENSSLIN